MTTDEIEAQVRSLGDWFHNLDLHGVQTAPNHFLGDFPRVLWRYLQDALPDVKGKSVLDVGCNGGFYSIQMKQRGAKEVVGIDVDPRYLEQARLATRVLGAEVDLRELSVYDVGALGRKFDVVIFMGVLYHLRHPLLALDLLREHVVGQTLIFQTMTRGSHGVMTPDEDYSFEEQSIFEQPAFPRMHFIEKKYSNDQTNWWIPNRACVEAMLRSSGFEIVDHPHAEVYVCRVAGKPAGEGAVHPARSEG